MRISARHTKPFADVVILLGCLPKYLLPVFDFNDRQINRALSKRGNNAANIFTSIRQELVGDYYTPK